MKKILLFLILLSTNFSTAQTHRFFYALNFLNNTSSNEFQREIVVLDVNPNNIKFYANEYLVTDSLNLASDFKSVKMAHPVFKNIIKKSLNSENFENFEFIQAKYYVYETDDKMKWKILPAKDKLGIYNIQKAETDFGGRHWIAWFTTDIPLLFGPYKFGGLPGLILKIADSKNEYSFSLISSKSYPKEQSTEKFVENFWFYENHIPLKISEKQMRKLKIDNFLDPYRSIRSNEEDDTFVDENGKPMKPDVRKMTEAFQINILNDNNPVEIDKAIKYPQN